MEITGRSTELNDKPGYYYLLVSPKPSGNWVQAFLEVAERDADGRELALRVDQSRIIYRPLDGKNTAECEHLIQSFMNKVGDS